MANPPAPAPEAPTAWGVSSAITAAETAQSVTYNMGSLITLVASLSAQAKGKIDDIVDRGENISIADMFDMQMSMNHLAQMSEMSSSVVNASNQSIMSMARNIK